VNLDIAEADIDNVSEFPVPFHPRPGEKG